MLRDALQPLAVPVEVDHPCVLIGVMIWELAMMTAPSERQSALTLAVVAGVTLVAALVLKTEVAVLFLIVPSVALLLTPRRDQRLAAAYALAIMLAGYGLVELRSVGGTQAILWLVAVVVASDVVVASLVVVA